MKKHPYDEAADREIAKHNGVRVVERYRTGGNKMCVVLEYRGKQSKVFYPATPSDKFRGPKRHANDIRRVLREQLGIAD